MPAPLLPCADRSVPANHSNAASSLLLRGKYLPGGDLGVEKAPKVQLASGVHNWELKYSAEVLCPQLEHQILSKL